MASADKTVIDFSIDIETLGTKPGSVVTEIGIANSHTADEFHMYLPINPQRQLGLMIEQETAKWHEENNPNYDTMLKACQALDQTQVELIQDLGLMGEHIAAIVHNGNVDNEAEYTPRIWMNSPQFDAVLLEVVFDLVGLPYPWHYRELRDLRTIRDLADVGKDHHALPEYPENAHDALIDAKYQLEIVTICRNHLNAVPF